MLYWPARSPLSASSRLPGGDLNASSVMAAWSSVSLRSATVRMFANLGTRRPSNRACVSGHRNVWIMKAILYRLPVNGKQGRSDELLPTPHRRFPLSDGQHD